jgi:hypothetical protein
MINRKERWRQKTQDAPASRNHFVTFARELGVLYG